MNKHEYAYKLLDIFYDKLAFYKNEVDDSYYLGSSMEINDLLLIVGLEIKNKNDFAVMELEAYNASRAFLSLVRTSWKQIKSVLQSTTLKTGEHCIEEKDRVLLADIFYRELNLGLSCDNTEVVFYADFECNLEELLDFLKKSWDTYKRGNSVWNEAGGESYLN